MKKKKSGFSCDISHKIIKTSQHLPSHWILSCRNIPQKFPSLPYKTSTENWKAVRRFHILGKNGERTAFEVRYFEISPKGYSSLEMHRHEHFILVLRGKGILRLQNKKYPILPMDIAYIPPWTIHQFQNPYSNSLGFLCIVDKKRDKPRLV